jgi:hypothetical protein
MKNNTQKNTYEIKIHKSNSDIINEFLFNPKIYKYKHISVVHDYLNFPHNWTTWHLPKRLQRKDIKITAYDKTRIVISW